MSNAVSLGRKVGRGAADCQAMLRWHVGSGRRVRCWWSTQSVLMALLTAEARSWRGDQASADLRHIEGALGQIRTAGTRFRNMLVNRRRRRADLQERARVITRRRFSTRTGHARPAVSGGQGLWRRSGRTAPRSAPHRRRRTRAVWARSCGRRSRRRGHLPAVLVGVAPSQFWYAHDGFRHNAQFRGVCCRGSQAIRTPRCHPGEAAVSTILSAWPIASRVFRASRSRPAPEQAYPYSGSARSCYVS